MTDLVEGLVDREYAFGFHSNIDTELAPKGFSEETVRLISATDPTTVSQHNVPYARCKPNP